MREVTERLERLVLTERRRHIAIGLILLVAVLVTYGRTVTFDFTDFDDPIIIYENPVVAKGLTLEGFWWVVRAEHEWNRHPLTWFSHMLDCQLFGLNPAGHHLTSLLLHLANVELVWLVLWAMTGHAHRSAAVALLFAIHPMNAEAVCWLAARKDLLSFCFALLMVWAYTRYVRRRRTSTYLLVLITYLLGLSAKANLITLPFALLLFDYWPLGQLSRPLVPMGEGEKASPCPVTIRRLLLEKLPLLGLVVLMSLAVADRQGSIGAVRSLDVLPLPERMANAVVAYATYLRRALWPSDLSAHYTHPYLAGGSGLTWWEIGGAGLLLTVLSVTIVRLRWRSLLVGWCWFLGTLVPVIGLVQIGTQAQADRYFYLSGLGLFVALVWGATELVRTWPTRTKWMAGALAGVVLLGWMAIGLSEIDRWRNAMSLWVHTVEREPNNPVALLNLGINLNRESRHAEAVAPLEKSVALRPSSARAQFQLGVALANDGRYRQALGHFRANLELDPGNPLAHLALGVALHRIGELDEAVHHLKQAQQRAPSSQTAARLAWILATRSEPEPSDGIEAVKYAEAALRLAEAPSAQLHDTRGVAYAAAGRFQAAIRAAEQALALAPPGEQRRAIEYRLTLYHRQEPFRAPPPTSRPHAPQPVVPP